MPFFARQASRHRSRAEPGRELVLVGGGHAHVQILRRWMMEPLPEVRLTVVLDVHEAVYSGMLPGAVAGDYATHELVIDVLPLARRAGARCIHAAATGIDARARSVALEGRPAIPYDVASLDVGSSVRGLDLPGVREHTLATRPIGRFLGALDRALARTPPGPLRVGVVGGGAAGVELALCLEARLRRLGREPHVTIVCQGETVLGGSSAALRRAVLRQLEARGIELRPGLRVHAASGEALFVGPERPGGAPAGSAPADSGSEAIPCELAVWATGAAPHPFLAASGLPVDAAGFVRVDESLRVVGCDDLFAVGDCAVSDAAPWVPRAGVYAVRQGPLLDTNLRARLRGRKLRPYRPQRDFLALLNAGDGRAIGGKWGLAVHGRPVWRLKDWIDRRFMARFQVLDAQGRPALDFPSPESMAGDEEEMRCGGCAAKLGPDALRSALERLPPPPGDPAVRHGLAEADDAAAFVTRGGDSVLASVDGFRAFTDDPWLVGRVAGINAVSDVQAKGGRARQALALVTVPDEGPRRSAEELHQVMAGLRAALDPLGVALLGGHSTVGPELFVGLAVTGELLPGASWLGLGGLREGDALVLTKPLGTGVALAADMRGLVPGRVLQRLVAEMLRDNGEAAAAAVAARAHAATDVSGFGLAGHLLEMLRASDRRAELDAEALPVLPGVLDLLRRGVRSTYHAQNAGVQDDLAVASGAVDPARVELLFDPQTAGGLLIGVAPAACEALLAQLASTGHPGTAVGTVHAREAGLPRLVVR